MSQFPKKVQIVEVSPRDGLQNEKNLINVIDKVQLINQLTAAGLTYIEAGSFVSPKWIPQMAASDEVFAQINRKQGVTYAAITPNLKGLEMALAANIDEIAVFTAASETFCQRNTNCSISESLERFIPVIEQAKQHNIKIRGYVSCVLGCPYEGTINPQQVTHISQELLAMGCYQVSLGDTIGVGTAASTAQLLDAITKQITVDKLAGHFHDTYGQALTNIYVSLLRGISVFDSSVAGLGGCPYAKGATGNVATEDVLYLLNGLGIETGINMELLIQAGNTICQKIGRKNGSRVANALLNKNSAS